MNCSRKGIVMEIRHIKKEDNRFAISRIYEESWKFAYQDIIPESC